MFTSTSLEAIQTPAARLPAALGFGIWDLGFNKQMARGWESKSVEAQQEAAADQRSKTPPVSAEESARRAERATLSLARIRALADLQKACAAGHRAMLEQAIAELDQRLAALENPKSQIPNAKSQ